MKFVMHNLKNISEFLKITDQYIELTLIEMSLKGQNQDWQASDEQARQIYMNPGCSGLEQHGCIFIIHMS